MFLFGFDFYVQDVYELTSLFLLSFLYSFLSPFTIFLVLILRFGSGCSNHCHFIHIRRLYTNFNKKGLFFTKNFFLLLHFLIFLFHSYFDISFFVQEPFS